MGGWRESFMWLRRGKKGRERSGRESSLKQNRISSKIVSYLHFNLRPWYLEGQMSQDYVMKCVIMKWFIWQWQNKATSGAINNSCILTTSRGNLINDSEEVQITSSFHSEHCPRGRGRAEHPCKKGFNEVLQSSAVPGLCHVSLSTGANSLINELSQMFLTPT